MTKNDLYQLIADQIGTEADDLNESDSLRDDLHMSSVDLAEIIQKIEEAGMGNVDLTEIDTIEELLEALNIDEE